MVQRRDDVVGLDAAILSPPAVWEASGHLRQLHRPSGRLPALPPALAGRQDRRGLPGLRVDRVHRGPGLQPHVQDPRRTARGRRGGRLPPPGDGPGDVRQLRQRAPDHPEEAALRHRPGGQVLPQRDHPAELRLPDPGVRADGDGVLRPARRGPTSGSSTGCDERFRWYIDLGHPRGRAPAAPPPGRRALPLLGGHRRRRVPLPLGVGRARGHRQPHRLRPQGPCRGLGGAARVLRPGHRRAVRALRDRAGGRRHPDHDGLPPVRLRRGRGRGRGPHRAAPPPPPGPLPGGGAPAVEEGDPRAAGPRRCWPRCSPTSCATTT